MSELVKEQEREEALEQGGSRNALTLCLYLLAAVNLVVMLVVTQLPIGTEKPEPLVLQGQAPGAHYASAGSPYRFQSCAGGGSVNCHRTGNQAGL